MENAVYPTQDPTDGLYFTILNGNHGTKTQDHFRNKSMYLNIAVACGEI